MKKYMIIYLAVSWVTVSGHGQTVDGIAAVVGDQPITFSEVKNKMWETEQTLREKYSGAADRQRLVDELKAARAAALGELIENKLFVRKFHGNGWISDSIIDRQIVSLIEREFSGDKQVFLKKLEDAGLTEADYRKLAEENIIASHVRNDFKRNHEKEFAADLPLREQPLYRQWIAELKNKTFVQNFDGIVADGEGAPATVSVDERWMSVVIPKIQYSDTDLAVMLANLEKMAADHGGKGLKLVLQEPPTGREANRKLTLSLVEVPLLKILSFMSMLSEYKLRIEGDTAYFYLSADGEAELIMMEIRTDADDKIQPEFFAPSGDAEQVDVTTQLRQKGIEFGKDCYAVFFPKSHQIVMYNSRAQCDALRELLVARYKAAAARLKTRMAATIISECDFTDAKISDVVGYLQKQINSQQADPKKSTINLLWQNSSPVQLPLVNLKLKNAPLTVILDTIQEAGDYTYRVEPYAVFIVPTEVINKSIYVRQFIVEPEFFAMKFGVNQSVNVSKELAMKGIEFKEGYSAFYIPASKKLTVRNTGEQMKKIEKLLDE
jgi:hypothetical protein